MEGGSIMQLHILDWIDCSRCRGSQVYWYSLKPFKWFWTRGLSCRA